MKWQPRWHRHASSHSAPTLNHNWSGSCNMYTVKHTSRGQSRQVHDQCTRGTIYDVCRLTRVVARVCRIKDCQRSETDYSAVTHCQNKLQQPYGQVPDQQEHTALSHRITPLTTLDYFASQRCGFEALYENTPNPHWIFRTIQYVLISSPTRKFLWQCTAEETTCCRATAESYFKSF